MNDGIERQMKDEEDARRELEIRTAQVREERAIAAAKRDPRVEPHAWDQLRRDTVSVLVSYVEPGFVEWMEGGIVRDGSLLLWVERMADAEIVKVADE